MEKKKKGKIDYTRLISGLVLFPIFAIVMIFANDLVTNIGMSIIAMISLYEYYNCFKVGKKANPSMWYGMLIAILTIFIQMTNETAMKEILIMLVPISILVLMIEMVLSKGKKNINDLIITIFGICYIPLLLLFICLIRAKFNYGKIVVWYVFFAAWGSDIFAYLIGKHFGKHHFTKISPGKTVEGCIAGVLGAVLMAVIYTIIINKIEITTIIRTPPGEPIPFAPNKVILYISPLMVGIITAILAFIGQIGDLLASSIKRYCGIKDFSELIPGHGGMLDRIDSVIFIAPFAYVLLGLLI